MCERAAKRAKNFDFFLRRACGGRKVETETIHGGKKPNYWKALGAGSQFTTVAAWCISTLA